MLDEYVFGEVRRVEIAGNTDASCNGELPLGRLEAELLNGFPDPFCHNQCAAAISLRKNNHELLTPETGGRKTFEIEKEPPAPSRNRALSQ